MALQYNIFDNTWILTKVSGHIPIINKIVHQWSSLHEFLAGLDKYLPKNIAD
jgi:hypothetical protein